MFKNRIRTAALAGAVAIATSISGLSVPAMAQTTQGEPTQKQRIEKVTEGTKEAQLNEKTKAVDEVLQKYTKPVQQEINDLGVSLEAVLKGNEAKLVAALKASKADVDAAREKASQNVAEGNVEVLAAKAADDALAAALEARTKIANETQKAIDDAEASLTSDARTKLQEAVNQHIKDAKEEDPSVTAAELDILGEQTLKGFDDKIEAFKQNVCAARTNSITPAASELLNKALNAIELAELRAPIAQLDKDTPGNLRADKEKKDKAAAEAVIAAQNEASKTDAVALQGLTNHAFNQLQALNVASNTYGAAIRYSEIEDKDALLKDENQTVREFYNEILRKKNYDGSEGLIAFAEEIIDSAISVQAVANALVGATPGSAQEYKDKRDSFVKFVAHSVVDPAWQVDLKRAGLLDARYIQELIVPTPEGSSLNPEAKKGLRIGGIVAGIIAALGAIGAVIWPHIKPIIDKFFKF